MGANIADVLPHPLTIAAVTAVQHQPVLTLVCVDADLLQIVTISSLPFQVEMRQCPMTVRVLDDLHVVALCPTVGGFSYLPTAINTTDSSVRAAVRQDFSNARIVQIYRAEDTESERTYIIARTETSST